MVELVSNNFNGEKRNVMEGVKRDVLGLKNASKGLKTKSDSIDIANNSVSRDSF